MTDTDRLTELEARVHALEGIVTQLQLRLGDELVPTAPPEAPPPRDLESTLGAYWLGRVGILALTTGLAGFVALHFGDLAPLVRVLAGYGLAVAIAGLGAWFSRSAPRFGHVVLGGGVATAYFVTHALSFTPRVRVLDNEVLGYGALVACVLGIVLLARKLASETLAGVGLCLCLHLGLMGESTVASLTATVLLALAAMYFFVAHRWVLVPGSSVLATYASHAFVVSRGAPAPVAATVALVLVFLVFAATLAWRPRHHTARAAGLFAAGNTVGFVALGAIGHESTHAGSMAALAAVVLLVAAAAIHRQRAPQMAQLHLALALPCAALAAMCLLPVAVALVAVAILGALCIQLVRAATPLASAGATGLIALVVGTWLAPSAVLGPLALAAMLAWATVRSRDYEEPWLERPARIALAGGAALGFVLAAHGLTSSALGWVIAAIVTTAVGFVLRERALRLAGLVSLVLGAGKLLIFDLADLPPDRRILAFVVSGALLLAVSFAYTRYKDRLQRLL